MCVCERIVRNVDIRKINYAINLYVAVAQLVEWWTDKQMIATSTKPVEHRVEQWVRGWVRNWFESWEAGSASPHLPLSPPQHAHNLTGRTERGPSG